MTTENDNQPDAQQAAPYTSGSELARVLLMHAVSEMLNGCGNSYANAYVEQWLSHAKSLGAYHGRTIGKIRDLKEEWEDWLDSNGDLPDLPDTPNAEVSDGN